MSSNNSNIEIVNFDRSEDEHSINIEQEIGNNYMK